MKSAKEVQFEENLVRCEKILLKCKEISPNHDFSLWEGLIYAANGEKEKALKIRKDVAWYYEMLGMREEYISAFLNTYHGIKQNISKDVISTIKT